MIPQDYSDATGITMGMFRELTREVPDNALVKVTSRVGLWRDGNRAVHILAADDGVLLATRVSD